MKHNEIYISIISSKRPERVGAMNLHAPMATWFVGKGEREIYLNAGAKNVIESGGLCESRNAALEAAFGLGLPCLQLSDDLKKVKKAHSKTHTQEIQLIDAVNEICFIGKKTGAKLCGVAPTSNPYFYNPEKPYKNKAFIVGDMILVFPCEVRFDEKMRLKEDYDFTLNHLKKYGKVLRVDNILAEFMHRSNKGGAVSYRTSQMENESIAYLKKKWGKAIRENPRRKDEILINTKWC